MTSSVVVCLTSEDLVQLRVKQPLDATVHSMLEVFCATLSIPSKHKVLSSGVYASFGMRIDESMTLKQVLEQQEKFFKADWLDCRLDLQVRPLVDSIQVANVLCSISNWIFASLEGASLAISTLLEVAMLVMDECRTVFSYRKSLESFQRCIGKLPWGMAILQIMGFILEGSDLVIDNQSAVQNICRAVQDYCCDALRYFDVQRTSSSPVPLSPVEVIQDEPEIPPEIPMLRRASETMQRSVPTLTRHSSLPEPLLRNSSAMPEGETTSTTTNFSGEYRANFRLSFNGSLTSGFNLYAGAAAASRTSAPSGRRRPNSRPSAVDLIAVKVSESNLQRDESCSICLEHFKVGDSLKLPHCLHKFHDSCLTQWIKHKKECPNCRTSLESR
eukprot:TRINITY_DN6365_c0_g1_i1.p1 TRINITY_DN6365_c0_g1~~TRINITY_DN6365_c0_g1_i1.p1  ORF type:complete len:387 (-),score=66.48 TRINITY_DN6365_c0_g1_i1:208-1368(-)